jgi:hypothetical protein
VEENPHIFRVVSGAPLPVRPSRKGVKLGKGKNLDMFAKMKPGDSIWDVPRDKMNSMRYTAWREKIKIKIRRIPDSDKYAIFRIS